MRSVDHLPWDATLSVATDTVENGQSIERRNPRSVASLPPGIQGHLVTLLAAVDAAIPALESVLIDGNLVVPTLSRDIVTILPANHPKVFRVYYRALVGLTYSREYEVSVMLADASGPLIAARNALSNEVFG